MTKIVTITGKPIILPEDDIDTDRIIPARFLKSVTFDELGAHIFEDDRAAARKAGKTHPFNDSSFREATILITGASFGSGSSREHAVHALIKCGINAIIARGVYSEIFFGNALANGLPCLIVQPEDWEVLTRAVGVDRERRIAIDIEAMTIAFGPHTISCSFQRPSAREALFYGSWDTLGILLERIKEADATIERLPYCQ